MSENKWIKFSSKAKVSIYRKIGYNIEIQEMFEVEEQHVKDFINRIRESERFNLPIGIKRNPVGVIQQSFEVRRVHIKTYVIINTVMRVEEWDRGRTGYDDFIPPIRKLH